MRVFSKVLCTIALTVAMSGLASAQQPSDDLTLEQALARALQSNPSLASHQRALRAAGARVDQSRLLPNPELDLEAENFGGRGALGGFDSAEKTVTISQTIVLGGKRKHRRAIAEARRTLDADDFEARRLDLVSETTTAFFSVLLAQERTRLGREQLELARRIASTVQTRTDAGKVSPVEATRTGIEVSKAQLRLARARRQLESARTRLAETWGSATPTFERAIGRVPGPIETPSLEQLRQSLGETPEIVRLTHQVSQQESRLALERAQRIPDLRIHVGTRRFEEPGQSAWVAGISFPLPIFDRKQGARRAAAFELERSRLEAESLRVAHEAGLSAALGRLHAAADEVRIVDQEVVPQAHAAFASIETGYRQGKFGFLDVLDAQRVLFEARALSLESRQDLLLARVELERRIGRPLAPSDDPPPWREETQGEER